jgi:uncharacterized membrane protein YfcA
LDLTYLDQLAAGGAALLAGAVNALAGGGTLISFPTLVGLGVPAVAANVTNTVSLVPGYLSGSWAQREDLKPQLQQARLLAGVAAVGGLAGSILLVVLPAGDFRAVVPYLILLACGLLAFGDRLKPNPPSGDLEAEDTRHQAHPRLLVFSIFLGSVYGGFFGAGLGIMILALLGMFSSEPLTKLNALKQALSFVINMVAAVFFMFSGRTVWALVPVMAVGSLVGGMAGGRLVRRIDADLLRRLVVLVGVAIAIAFWVA